MLGSEDTADELERLRAALTSLGEVRLAYLFGSRASGRGRAQSDYDIAVLVGRDAAPDGAAREKVRARIAGRLGREIPSRLLDLVILDDAPPLLRHRIVRNGTLLFEREPGQRARFVRDTIRDYQDMQVRRENFFRRRVERIEKGEAGGRPGDLLEKARGVARLLAQAGGVSRGQ